MNLSVVRESLRDALGTIDGLSVSMFQAASVHPPHAVVKMASGNYDTTMRRGLDGISVQIIVYVSRAADELALEQLDQFITGTGDKSIKTAVDAATGTGISYFRVGEFQVGTASLGSEEFLAATFDVEAILTGLS